MTDHRLCYLLERATKVGLQASITYNHYRGFTLCVRHHSPQGSDFLIYLVSTDSELEVFFNYLAEREKVQALIEQGEKIINNLSDQQTKAIVEYVFAKFSNPSTDHKVDSPES